MKYSLRERKQIHMDDAQIIDLVRSLIDESEQSESKIIAQASINEQICNGVRKNSATAETASLRTNQAIEDDEAPYVPQLILPNLVKAFSSGLTKERPSAYGVPAGDDLISQRSAKLVTKLIEYIEVEQEVVKKLSQSVTYGTLHGSGGMKICKDPKTNQVHWRSLSVFDFYLQNKTEASDVEWVIFREFIGDYDAAKLIYDSELIKSEQVDPETGEVTHSSHIDEDYVPAEIEYTDATGLIRKGVPKYEIWYLPSSRYPTGLMATVIDDRVVESMVYPYVFADKQNKTVSLLPICWFVCSERRGATLGTTWVTACAAIQNAINETLSRIQVNNIQAQQIMLIPKGVLTTENLTYSKNLIVQFDENQESIVDGINAGGWWSPAPMDQNIISMLDRLISNMYDTAGLSESTIGQGSSSQSGTAKQLQSDLDYQKHADTFKRLEKFIQQCWNLSVKIEQRFPNDQIESILGPGTAELFASADVQGVTVRLEDRTGVESTQEWKSKNAAEQAAGGLITGTEYMKQTNNPTLGLSNRLADIMIGKFLNGEDVQITSKSMPPEAFIANLDKHIEQASLSNDMELAEKLDAFKSWYLDEIAQEGQQDMQAAPAEEPMPQEQPQQPQMPAMPPSQ